MKTDDCVCLRELDKLRMLHEEGKVYQLALSADIELDGKPMTLTFSHKPDDQFMIRAVHDILDVHLGSGESE